MLFIIYLRQQKLTGRSLAKKGHRVCPPTDKTCESDTMVKTKEAQMKTICPATDMRP